MVKKNSPVKGKKPSKILLFLSVLICSITLCTGCAQEEKEASLPLVKTMTIGESKGQNTLSYTGKVQGTNEIHLAFQVSGKIKDRYASVGTKLLKGDIICTLDEQDIIEKVTKARANVDITRADLLLAKKNFQRYETLYSEGAIPLISLDEARFGVEAKEARLDGAEATLKEAENALSYTALRAPKDGTIAHIEADIGQVVAAGRPVAILLDESSLEVVAHVSEKDLFTLQLGDEVSMSFWALKGSATKGRIKEISPLATPLANSYKVVVTIFDPPKELKAGMTAQLNIKTQTNVQKGIYIPTSAILETNKDPFVWKINTENKAEKMPIKTFEVRDDEILVEGLAQGDIIVTKGVQKIHAGEEVRILSEEKQ